MPPTPNHNTVLKRAARASLESIGAVQKGRSRIWYDDRSWFVTMVEFQPSGFGKGSYLNVGAAFLWWPDKQDLGFDYGYREGAFQEADVGDWEAKVTALAEHARRRCLEIREELPDVPTTSALLNRQEVHPAAWLMCHAAVAAALAGDAALARRRLDGILAHSATYDWERERHRVSEQLMRELGDLDGFREARIADIQRTRQRERLPRLDDDTVRQTLVARAARLAPRS
jgi:hypothetical protein